MTTENLFKDMSNNVPQTISLADGAVLLRGFVKDIDQPLLQAVEEVAVQSPFRHMITPGGFRMSVAMTNCGSVGWVTDSTGYRYDPIDPENGKNWPVMPAVFLDTAKRAATVAGFEKFYPDACLINCYEPGARLSLHQDKDERDADAPIVSVSLGLTAIFLFGGNTRSIRPKRYQLEHGDVVVWGGPSRFVYHGIAPLAQGSHPVTGARRINLTFRKAR